MVKLFSKAAAPAVAVAGLLFDAAEAVKVQAAPHLRGGVKGTVEMMSYRSDCFRKPMSLIQNPGDGMNPDGLKPYEMVYKDGFYMVDCVKDYMFQHGDKFGNKKDEYKAGEFFNVSIVHYSSHVAKEDREQMTIDTCFKFCRTVEGMSFFGLTNGRECYCTPFFKAEAGDSSQCDAPCDGNPGTMCGGARKSSVFGMHQCGDHLKELEDSASAGKKAHDELVVLVGIAETMGSAMQEQAVEWQAKFGKAGDPGAADLMQDAKLFAGKLEAAWKTGRDPQSILSDLADKEIGTSTGSLAEVTKAEEMMAEYEEATANAQTSIEELTALTKLRRRVQEHEEEMAAAEEGTAKPMDQYYSLMYFVDKAFQNQTSTCTGNPSEKPVVGTQDACARLCNDDLHECVGYSFVGGASAEGLCFLMSKFTTATHYTECGKMDVPKCFAKLSKFDGTSIAPKADGTCENCLKEVTKADRCFD
jgi:hypothetical protein